MLRKGLVVLAAAVVVPGCATVGGYPGSGRPDVIVVGDDDRRGGVFGSPASLRIEPGHYPPPGECRIWYLGRPAGHQPPPARCDRLAGRIPLGAFILYNEKGWDTRYDWDRHERHNPGTVPGIILRLMHSLVRD